MAKFVTVVLLVVSLGSGAFACRAKDDTCTDDSRWGAELRCCDGRTCKLNPDDTVYGTCQDSGSPAAKPAVATTAASRPATTRAGAPTTRSPATTQRPTQPSAPVSGALVTKDQFVNAIKSCGFPAPRDAQYVAFVSMAGPAGDIKDKRELAMMLANVVQETRGLTVIKEENTANYNSYQGWDPVGVVWPGKAANGKQYYGRGYLQLSWPSNYMAASRALYNNDDLWNNPDKVASDEGAAWGTAFWYWKTQVHALHKIDIDNGKFGATIKAINGDIECHSPTEQAKNRFNYYKKILVAFGITEPAIENGCYN